jgi:hypothetical protein
VRRPAARAEAVGGEPEAEEEAAAGVSPRRRRRRRWPARDQGGGRGGCRHEPEVEDMRCEPEAVAGSGGASRRRGMGVADAGKKGIRRRENAGKKGIRRRENGRKK